MGGNRRKSHQHHGRQSDTSHASSSWSQQTSWSRNSGSFVHKYSKHQDALRRLSLSMQEVTTFGGNSGYNRYDESTANVDDNDNEDSNNSGDSSNSNSNLLFLAVAMLCITIVLTATVGISLGMTVSVHYFDTRKPVANGRGLSEKDSYLLYSGLSSAYQKVTSISPSIATSNVIRRQGDDSTLLDLGKVITTTKSGQLSVLMVVQEEPALHEIKKNGNVDMDDDEYDDDEYDDDDNLQQYETATTSAFSSSDYYDDDDDIVDGIPLSMEQAEQLLPGYREWKESQPNLDVREPTMLPTLCSSDGITYGFDDYERLRAAVQEANSISAERFMKWSEYFATHKWAAFEDDSLYYEQDVVFTICPGSTLKASRRSSGPIVINAENVVLECYDGCEIDVRGTHLAFGANAKNVLVRGITFRGATASSVTFFHDGAEATFEDCTWINNLGVSQKFGSVADINSTSIVNFFRCEIGFEKQTHPFGGVATKSTSSLSIRSN